MPELFNMQRWLPGAYGKFASNSAWLMFGPVASALVSVLVAALVARYLGPVDFGKVAYAYSMAAIFAIIGQLGMDGLVVRELKTAPSEASITLGTVMGLKLLAFGSAAGLLMAFVLLIPGHDAVDRGLFAFAAIFTLLSTLNSLTAWFHSRVEGRTVSLTSLAGTLSGSAAKVALVFASAGAVWFGAANVVTAAATVALLLIAFHRSNGPPITKWRFSAVKARSLVAEGGLILLGSFFAIIYFKIDLAMLRWMSEPSQLGEYAVAAQLSEAAYIIPSAIVASVFPRLIELRGAQPADYDGRFQQVFDILLLAALAVVGGGYLFGGLLLAVLFGEAYAGSTSILLIHILAAPFIFMHYAVSRWLLIERLAHFTAVTHAVGAAVNVSLNLILIPTMGGIGAAIATVLSYAAASYLALAFHGRTRPIFFMMSGSLFILWSDPKRVLRRPARG